MENAYAISTIPNRNQARYRTLLGKAISTGFTRLLGCWHSEMGLPFTIDGRTYRTCISCGLKRDFDPLRWKTYGPYYRG